MRYHLFVIGGPYTDAWWARNLSMRVITAGFDNEEGDRGSIYLRDMDRGDWVIAYAKGSGAVGAGTVGGKDTYRILRKRDLPADFESRHRQFRSVKWTHYVETLAEAVSFGNLRLGFAPRNTKTEFSDQDNARRIIQLLAAKSNGVPPTTHDAADLEPPERIPTTTYRILRDTLKSRRVKAGHKFKCQVCGKTIELSDGSRYAEGHHIQPLGGEHKGPDVEGNILCLCPNHHAEYDLGVSPIRLSSLRPAKGHVVEQVYVDYHNRVICGSSAE
jgi:HNH endonuclease